MCEHVSDYPALPGTTSVVHRRDATMAGLRTICDDATPVQVHASSFTDAACAMTALLVDAPACYILASANKAYIGETSNPVRRVAEHAVNPDKAFAAEVFVISAPALAAFDKQAVKYFQYRLTQFAIRAGLVEVVMGQQPEQVTLPAWRQSQLDRMLADTLRLLFDAGCRVFDNPYGPFPPDDPDVGTGNPRGVHRRADLIATTSLGTGVLEFDYCGIKARGLQTANGFLILPGSEVRTEVNPSGRKIIASRQEELERAGMLEPIPGVSNRKRLTAVVECLSPNQAAQIIAGGQVRAPVAWRGLGNAPPVIAVA